VVHLRVNSRNPKGAAYFREAGFRNVEVKDVLEIVTLLALAFTTLVGLTTHRPRGHSRSRCRATQSGLDSSHPGRLWAPDAISRAKSPKAMRSVLLEDDVRAGTQLFTGLATKLASTDVATSYMGPLTRDLVGRPGLDPGTLRVFPERPPMSISVQICWTDEVERPPTSTEVHSSVTSWLVS